MQLFLIPVTAQTKEFIACRPGESAYVFPGIFCSCTIADEKEARGEMSFDGRQVTAYNQKLVSGLKPQTMSLYSSSLNFACKGIC